MENPDKDKWIQIMNGDGCLITGLFKAAVWRCSAGVVGGSLEAANGNKWSIIIPTYTYTTVKNGMMQI